MNIPDDVLLRVEKPGRYIGNELNIVRKNPEAAGINFALCFPDVYDVGMSWVGLSVMYYLLNKRDDVYCQRAFAPWPDMEQQLRSNGIPLYALETYEPLKNFDFIGFTLQYEMSYTNIINMLDLSGISLFSRERGEDEPIVCAGGPCAYNPEPLADIMDFFYLGEAEAAIGRVMDAYNENKTAGGSKRDFLKKLLTVEGVYVPCFYDVSYKDTGEIASFLPNDPLAPVMVNKVAADVKDMFYPEKQLVPLIETVHDRVAIEVFRGCIRGCRFCQAGFIYRPVRERDCETLICQAEKLLSSAGYEEVSLVSLSTGDYGDFKELAEELHERFAEKKVNISLPSLRIDAFTLELMERAKDVRKSGLTFAPEAGSQRLRDVINKNLTEEEILDGCALAFNGGWDRVKLYFMVGLPTETQEDLKGIARLSGRIIDEYYKLPYEQRKRPPSVTVSASCFVPKPFTPFQWEAQNSSDVFMEKQRMVKNSIDKKQISYNYHDPMLSVIEGAVARGDRRVGHAVVEAWRLGARFDGWSEYFDFDVWRQAFDETGPGIEFYAGRERGLDEILPWDHISVGVSKSFLLNEREKAYAGITTENCRDSCAGCGAAGYGGICVEC